MLGTGKIFLVIVYINANSPKRDKDVLNLLINGNNGLFKILKKKEIKKLISQHPIECLQNGWKGLTSYV
jgi:hypothetical protein